MTTGAASSPTIPDYQGPLDDSTRALAAACRAHAASDRATRFDRAQHFDVLAAKLERCAVRDGWRCGASICPRCQRRLAVRYRRRLEARLRAPGTAFALLTATVAGDDLRTCERVLIRALSALRRRQAWRRAFVGGEQHLQAEPCRPGAARHWNTHVHTVVELLPQGALPRQALASIWTELIAPSGLPGRLDLRAITGHWAIHTGGRMDRFVSKVAFYATRRKPKEWIGLPADRLLALQRFLKRQRRVTTFGTWRRPRRPAEPITGNGGSL